MVKVNIGGKDAVATRASVGDSDYETWARSIDDYMYGLSDADMKTWPVLTDELLEQQSTITNALGWAWSEEKGSYPYYIGNAEVPHYRIASGTTVQHVLHANGAWGQMDNVVLYVEGKLVLQPENTLNGVTVVVAPGGELNISGEVNFSNSSRFIVEGGGKITGGIDAYLKFNNGCTYSYNAGTIDVSGKMCYNGGTLYNASTISCGTFEGNSFVLFINMGKLYSVSNPGNNDAYNANYVNGCYIHFMADGGHAFPSLPLARAS